MAFARQRCSSIQVAPNKTYRQQAIETVMGHLNRYLGRWIRIRDILTCCGAINLRFAVLRIQSDIDVSFSIYLPPRLPIREIPIGSTWNISIFSVSRGSFYPIFLGVTSQHF
ncbi:unnamed protein product [Periconia digitata]|uniref:Uncharacterized protein n=1 Tax=Periconia digitata TaxID=1303443 RepID=A0A9W4XCU3_9PLEO|nr:unnamed protein product [Periconia digitata]